ncbi:MAG: hypothetical protein IH598_07350 [Bacteroidales bacterium]|nr:hypothetical protein [Bacteroidales bacterium]
MRKIILIILWGALWLGGCKKQDEHSQFHQFKNGVWERFEFVNFEFPVHDARQRWDIYLVLRYNESFQGRLLPLNIEMVTPSGDSRVKDYNLFLRSVNNDEITGERSDGFYEQKVLTHPQFSFSEKGICKFEIENLNSNYFTQGILEIGFILEPSSN